MATVREIGVSFVIVLFFNYVNSLKVLTNSHILNKRQFPPPRRCFVQSIVCSENPYQYCDSGVCLEVTEKTDQVPNCVPKCGLPVETTQPASSTKGPVGTSKSRTVVTNINTLSVTNWTSFGLTNVTSLDATNVTSLSVTNVTPLDVADENVTNETSLRVTNVTPLDVTNENVTNNTSLGVTNETTTTYPSSQAVGSFNWKLDRGYCEINFFCRNGGYCFPDYIAYRDFIPFPDNLRPPRVSARCICPENWLGTFCQYNCSLQCGNNGACIVGNGKQYCTCFPGFTPPDCQPKPITSTSPDKNTVKTSPSSSTSEVSWSIPVLVVCAVLLAVLLTYVILIKFRWKSMIITKVFHYFQPYENDDEMLFDVFISFRSTHTDCSKSEDEKFVSKVLHPVLEKQFSYKVCVHYRDFPPGQTITNNIIWAVKNSRRTILVLSPLYVEREWARLEYQNAQQEMLQLRHKIIPIIFEDISNVDIEDSTLNEILSSVTYINYPKVSDAKRTEQFWSMLQLALPKKRTSDTLDMTSLTPNTSTSLAPNISTSLEPASKETAPGSSPENLQSPRTDVTDISEETRSYGQNVLEDIVIDINEIDKGADKKK